MDKYAFSPEAFDGLGMTLRIWIVNESPAYQVYPRRLQEQELVAIRTQDGLGSVEMADYGRFTLAPGTIFLAEIARLRHYGTAGDRWRFSWFEFTREHGVGHPWHTVLSVPPPSWEDALIETVFARLSLPDVASQNAAYAEFNALLNEWAACWQRSGDRSNPQRDLVYRAITRMQHTLANPPTLDALAGEFGISTRWLRRAFLAVLGVTPKTYFTDLRLRQAAQELQMGLGSVTHIAERLGYASPFHFSRAFRAKFGRSPSIYGKERHMNE